MKPTKTETTFKRSTLKIILLFLALAFLGSLVLFWYQQMVDISHPFRFAALDSSKVQEDSTKPIYYFGVISRFPPTLIYQGYQPIMDYLNRVTAYHFELKLSESYKQTVAQLTSGKVVAAFLGSFLFAKEGKAHRLHCLLKPLNAQKKPLLQAIIVTTTSSDIQSVKDLRGKRVALPSSLSFSANWFLCRVLPQNQLAISDLDSVYFFAHHHTVIYELLKGHFDAGVVKDRVAHEFLNRGIRIIKYSAPIPSSPIVVSEKSPQKVVQAIRQALLAIDVQKPEFKKIVKNWDAELASGFVPAHDSDYHQIQTLLISADGHSCW